MRATQHFPVANAQALYAAGLSLRDVSTALGWSSCTVRSWLLASGVQLRSRGGANHLGAR